MKKKIFTEFMILFVCLSTLSAGGVSAEHHSVNGARGNILYVGGSGSGNFTSIQDAINAASDGDTVFVYDDSSPYYENIIVNKSIILKGEDQNTTTINGNYLGNVINVSADNVTVMGFNIIHGGLSGANQVAGIFINSRRNLIQDNTIHDSYDDGIYLYNSSQNVIYGNTITNCGNNGIYCGDQCNFNDISGNVIGDNFNIGIEFSYSTTYTFIHHNIITKNQVGVIVLSPFNSIISNTIKDNSNADLISTNSYNMTIRNNTFGYRGVEINGNDLWDWDTYTIENNTVNGKPLLFYRNVSNLVISPDLGQLILANCSNCSIQNCVLSNIDRGIQLSYSSKNRIIQNQITASTEGISLDNSYNNTIENNTLTQNIVCIRVIDSSHNSIKGNSCVSNHWGIIIGSYDGFKGYNNVSNNQLSIGELGIGLGSQNETIFNNSLSDFSYGINPAGIEIDYYSYNCTISSNSIKNCSNGIYIYFGHDIIITANTFENNTNTFNIYYESSNLSFFYNNFMSHGVVNEGLNNTWDDGKGMGNYWGYRDDFVDRDGDGIADDPINVPGTLAQDHFPLMFPYGKETGGKITRPVNGWLYLRNLQFIDFFVTLIFGKITVEVNAANYMYGINNVQFYIDHTLQYTDFTPPFQWKWAKSSHIQHRHSIDIVINDNNGNSKHLSEEVIRFF
jgi:parallel beta-helix repeat protein